MARSVPKSFYTSRAWQACRASYLQLHPLCEDCLMRGIYMPAAHVHHMIWLTPDNWQDAGIALNHANLRALCVECHNRRHSSGEQPKRWRVDEAGRIAPLSEEY